jgi:ABC-type Na+ efflux pump permease subunit
MTFQLPPIIERELRLASRRPGNYWGRAGSAAIALVFGFGIIVGNNAVGRSPIVGQGAFAAVGVVGGILLFISVLQLSAEAFVKEKREDTLGLLFLTPLKPLELVLGKLLSTSLPAFYRFVAVVPIMGLPLMMGGVSLADFLLLVLGLLGLVLLSAAMGLFCSALSWDEKVAGTLATVIVVVLVGIGPLILYSAGRLFQVPWSQWLLALTPIYPAWNGIAHQSVPGMAVLLSVGWTSVLIWFVLSQTCRVLPRCWRSRPNTLANDARSVSRPISSVASVAAETTLTGLRRFKFSRKFSREQRADLLDRNPILWLALSSQSSLTSVWIIGGICLVLPVIALLASDNLQGIIEPGLALGVAFAINAVLKLTVATLASTALVREHPRESLELLLSTPVTARELVDGHAMAIRQTVQPYVVRLLWVEVAWLGVTIAMKAMSNGPGVVEYTLAALAVVGFLVPDLYAVGWSSLWQGVTARNAREAEQEGMRVLVMPWLGLFLAFTLVFPLFGNIRDELFAVLTWMLCSFFSNRWITNRARRHLANDLEAMARRRASGEVRNFKFWTQVGRWLARWWASGK